MTKFLRSQNLSLQMLFMKNKGGYVQYSVEKSSENWIHERKTKKGQGGVREHVSRRPATTLIHVNAKPLSK